MGPINPESSSSDVGWGTAFDRLTVNRPALSVSITGMSDGGPMGLCRNTLSSTVLDECESSFADNTYNNYIWLLFHFIYLHTDD